MRYNALIINPKKGEQNMLDENRYKGFWQDFTIAEASGVKAIRDTYNRAFKGWKNNVEYFASLVMTLNHKIWRHYEEGNETLTDIYNELWEKSYYWGLDNYKDEDAAYFIDFLD